MTCLKLTFFTAPVTATPFLEWAEERKLLVTSPFADICNVDTGPVIGIHASYYLEQFRQPAKEPLVAALGGSPLNLETLITTEIKEMQKMGCKFWFFFDGLDCRFDDDSAPFEASISAMDTGAQAFQLYDAGNAVGAIDTFKRSGL